MKPYPQSRRRANLCASSQPQHVRTSGRASASSLLLLALFLALAPTASASSTWFVDGVNGSNNNNCKAPQTACKTIGHAISLASSGDSIMVAAATYKENLTIRLSLKIVGSSAKTTIIDGGCAGRVVTVPNFSTYVTLAKVTIQHGCSHDGAGIYNNGTLTVNKSTVSGNQAGRGLANGYAGGIENNGTLTINNSTVNGNGANGNLFAPPSAGGGIYNAGLLTISNSTLSGNGAAHGGGVFDSVLPTFQKSVVANNSGGTATTRRSRRATT
jgi:hypothetical protein